MSWRGGVGNGLFGGLVVGGDILWNALIGVFFIGDDERSCREADEFDVGVEGGVESGEVNAGEGGRCTGITVGLGGKIRGLGRLRMKRGEGVGNNFISSLNSGFACEASLVAKGGWREVVVEL